jgi:dihydrofolate reductase
MKVFIVAALTADGFIGRDAKHLADWTSSADKKLFVKLTKEAGVMIMGSRTFATIGRALPDRHTIVYTPDAARFKDIDIETTAAEPTVLIEDLSKRGYDQVAICGGASIYAQFLKSRLVDELYLTIAPKLFGTGISLLDGEIEEDLRLLDVEKLDEDTVLLHYLIKK